MPAAIIGAVIAGGIAAIAGGSLLAIAAAAALGMVVGMALFSKKPKMPNMARSASERKQTLRSSAGSVTACYGRTYTGGLLVFAEEQEGEQEYDDKEELYVAVVVCGHEISSLERIDLNDDSIESFGDYATYTFHNADGLMDDRLLKNAPSWKDDMFGKGLAWCSFTLKYDQDKFPSGIPNFKFLKKGKKVLDPRDNNVKYSNNAALVILDYLRSYVGVKDAEINWEEFKTAANLCDESVENGDGTASARYTIDGEFDLDEARVDILNAMYEACAGEHTYRGGLHGVQVGAYYGPAIHTLTEDHVAGDLKIVSESSYREKVNVVTGTYVEPNQDFTEIDYPRVEVDEWIDEDGREFIADIKYRFVNNAFTCQRLATMTMRRKRYGRTIEVPVNMVGYVFRPGLNILVNLPFIGLENKEFKVISWKMDLKKGVSLVLREDRAEFYGDAKGVAIDQEDLIYLPKPSVAQPTNIQYTASKFGEVVQGFLTWETRGDVSYSLVQIYDNKTKALVYNIQVPQTRANLNGLDQGTYIAEVYAVNHTGLRSPAGTLLFDISAPSAPTVIDIEHGYFALTLKPKSSNINGVTYDFWTSGQVKLANTNTDTVEKGATRLGTGSFWTQNQLDYMATYFYYVRCTNIYGSSKFIEVSGTVDTELEEFWGQLDDKFAQGKWGNYIQSQIGDNFEALMEQAAMNDWNYQYQVAQSENFKAQVLRIDKTIANNETAIAESLLKLSASMNETIDTKIDGVNTAVNDKIDGVNTKVDNSVNNLNGKIDTTNTELGKTNTNVANANKNIEGLNTQVSQQGTKLNEHGQLINEQGQQIVRNSADLEQKATTVFNKDGTAYSKWDLKVGVTYQNQFKNAGMSVWAELKAGVISTGIGFLADSFSILTTGNGAPQTVFYAEGGKVYLKDAIISKAQIEFAQIKNVQITNAMIKGDLFSGNFINLTSGWIFKQNGEIQINGSVAGQGRMRILPDQIMVWDGQGRPRVKIGNLTRN
ncbi:hypothetical protein [Vibrio phage vB_VibM_83AMN]|nr:hypothetical protein [Vibrio phage vB_VibM_83AMN]